VQIVLEDNGLKIAAPLMMHAKIGVSVAGA
jgi:hypothetical protein